MTDTLRILIPNPPDDLVPDSLAEAREAGFAVGDLALTSDEREAWTAGARDIGRQRPLTLDDRRDLTCLTAIDRIEQAAQTALMYLGEADPFSEALRSIVDAVVQERRRRWEGLGRG